MNIKIPKDWRFRSSFFGKLVLQRKLEWEEDMHKFEKWVDAKAEDLGEFIAASDRCNQCEANRANRMIAAIQGNPIPVGGSNRNPADGPEQRQPKPKKDWRGCTQCFGSGGPKRHPCQMCQGSGRLPK